MIHRIGQAFVAVVVVLLLIAEAQRVEDAQAQHEIELMYGARP